MKNMRQLINLMEDVQAVPGIGGSEADMQTAGTVGRDSADASFDAAQTPATESAPPGEEKLVKSLKKEYPGHEEKAFATAWSIYNKKHGKKESMEEEAQVVSCNQDNPENADEACKMEESMEENTPAVAQALASFESAVMTYGMDPEEAYDRIIQTLGDEDIGEFRSALEMMGKMDSDAANAEPEFDDGMDGDFDSAMASAGHGSDEDYGYYGDDEMFEARPQAQMIDPTIVNQMASMPHDLAKETALDILNSTNTDDRKKQYLARQIETSRNTMGVVKLMYDMLLKGEGLGVQGSSYSKKFDKGMEEDIQNGYNDINVANGSDYFPNGADSPVVKATGPSGARQGDNPEQKKMQVSEVHKELVYNYRSFLSESAKKKS
jgi:hypothetical protein